MKSTEEFIKELPLKFKKDFSIVGNYTGARNKISIIGKDNIYYEMTPSRLLSGCLPNLDSAICKTAYFKIKSTIIHNGKYFYNNSVYICAKDRISIICPIHGDFLQKTISHLKGAGCIKCVNRPGGYNLSSWVKAGNVSKKFESYKIYTIKCWNKNEIFYKIGRTFLSLQNRFNNNKSVNLPYYYQVINIIEGEADYIFKLEKQMHKKLKKYKYLPNKKFNGMTECFIKIKI